MTSGCGGNRPAELCKEITKNHESFIGETLSDTSIFFKKNEEKRKGEFTVAAQGSSAIEGMGEELDRAETKLRVELSRKKAVEMASKKTKHSKAKTQERALKNKNQ
jgi:Predicted methyltransferases